MPWSDPVQQRRQFIDDVTAGYFTVTELCERYCISRKTGYKWLRRYDELGDEGLRDRSRRPKHCPHKTDAEVQEALLELRRRFRRFGPKKLLARLAEQFDEDRLPAISTAADILKRHGLISKRRRRRSQPPAKRPVTQAKRPNHVWTIDFKGEFLMRNARYCYPLTVADDYSRYVICTHGMHAPESDATRKVLERVFRHHGLPDVMLSDNGTPFASNGLGRLSRLCVWWMRLGIRLERTRLATPTDNASHERMHRELKAECTRPPERNLKRQQARFEDFLHLFNVERPHESLDMRRPAAVYTPSKRPYPETLPELRYPGHHHVTRVNNAGCIRLKKWLVFLSTALADQHVAFHEIDDGIWAIHFARTELGRFDERTRRLQPGGALGPKAANRRYGKDR